MYLFLGNFGRLKIRKDEVFLDLLPVFFFLSFERLIFTGILEFVFKVYYLISYFSLLLITCLQHDINAHSHLIIIIGILGRVDSSVNPCPPCIQSPTCIQFNPSKLQIAITEAPAVRRVACPGGDGNRTRRPQDRFRLPKPLCHPSPHCYLNQSCLYMPFDVNQTF